MHLLSPFYHSYSGQFKSIYVGKIYELKFQTIHEKRNMICNTKFLIEKL